MTFTRPEAFETIVRHGRRIAMQAWLKEMKVAADPRLTATVFVANGRRVVVVEDGDRWDIYLPIIPHGRKIVTQMEMGARYIWGEDGYVRPSKAKGAL